MTNSDPVLTLLERLGPKSSFEIRDKLVSEHNLSSGAVSKRLERLVKRKKIARYMRLVRGGFIYYIPKIHPKELLKETARNSIIRYRPLLARVFRVLNANKVLSRFELSRLANAHFYAKDGAISQRIMNMLDDLRSLGVVFHGDFLFSPELKAGTNHTRLIAEYEASLYEEAALLHLTKKLFISTRRAEELTIYRRAEASSLLSKYDMVGHGGWKRRIRVIVECNLRRSTTTPDLVGFHQRVGGTYKKSFINGASNIMPIAYYYVINGIVDDEAGNFAYSKRIRLLSLESILSGHLRELRSFKRFREGKPWVRGRLSELKGIAFEAIIGHVYVQEGFKVKVRKEFFIKKGHITDRESKRARKLTDIDVYAIRDSEFHLVECKSSREILNRKELFEKIGKYSRVANFLQRKIGDSAAKIFIIANVNEVDKIEAKRKFRVPLDFSTPNEFYELNQNLLRGLPKHLFEKSIASSG